MQNSPEKKEIEEERKSLNGSDDLFKTPPEGVSEDDEPKKSGSSDEQQDEQVAKPAMLSQET